MFDHRVYEILAKWIASNSNTTVTLKVDGVPKADVESKHIELPYNIQQKHIFPALALLMHESAHIRKTTYDWTRICGSETYFPVLNCTEDARIDMDNMGMLPNVREFYRGLYTKELAKANIQGKDKAHDQLTMAAYEHIRFTNHLPHKKRADRNVMKAFEELISSLDSVCSYQDYYGKDAESTNNRYKIAEVKFKELIKALGLPEPPPAKQGGGQGEGDHKKDNQNAGGGQQGQDQSNGGDQSGASGNREGQQGDQRSKSTASKFVEGDKVGGGSLHEQVAGEIFKKTDKYTLQKDQMPDTFFREQTKETLKEILNQKLKKVEYNGHCLNTDSLMDFFTGDVETLFIDDEYELKKKAKVLFLVDGSGSMYDSLVDKTSKVKIVREVMGNIMRTLDEVRDLEGQDVEYRIARFCNHIHEYVPPQEFVTQFKAGGGTWLSHAFDWAINEISAEDANVGARIVVCMTDGEVCQDQVNEVIERLQQTPNEIRVVLLGIGCDISGKFVKKIIGNDRNIMIKDQCEQIIMNAVMDALQN